MKARVERRLATAGLLDRKFDAASEVTQYADDGLAHARKARIRQARNKERNTHAAKDRPAAREIPTVTRGTDPSIGNDDADFAG